MNRKENMNRKMGAIALCALLLTGCTAGQVSNTTTAIIAAEIAASIAAGYPQGVLYGDALLTGVSCVTTEYASTDTAVIKYAKYGLCGSTALANAPIGHPEITAIATAAFTAFLAAYQAAQPAPAARSLTLPNGKELPRVVTTDGAPSRYRRNEALAAAAKALAARRIP